MANPDPKDDKWGFPLQDLYRIAWRFYKKNSGKAIHLSYEENLKLIAFKQQASMGPFDIKHAPELGVLDVIGRDRRVQWQMLGDLNQEEAMNGFIDLLDTMCQAFRPYVEALKKNRDESLKADLRRMKEESAERERCLEQQQKLEEDYKEELYRRQMQDALNKQTYTQFKAYAEKQFPGNPEQQAVLIHQLQQEHFHQYLQQVHLDNAVKQSSASMQSEKAKGDGLANSDDSVSVDSLSLLAKLQLSDGSKEDADENRDTAGTLYSGNQFQQQQAQQLVKEGVNVHSDHDYVIIQPAKIWTRPDIVEFKVDVAAGEGDGVINVSHGDTVTVRVPTNPNGKCIFWEFATDNYDIGFGVYFEWCRPETQEVIVQVSDTDVDDDDYLDDDGDADAEEADDEDELESVDNLNNDVESGSTTNNRLHSRLPSQQQQIYSMINNDRTPFSIIVPIYRRESHNEVYVGSHAYPGEGIYLLKFDNSYSIWRSKTLYYRVYYER